MVRPSCTSRSAAWLTWVSLREGSTTSSAARGRWKRTGTWSGATCSNQCASAVAGTDCSFTRKLLVEVATVPAGVAAALVGMVVMLAAAGASPVAAVCTVPSSAASVSSRPARWASGSRSLRMPAESSSWSEGGEGWLGMLMAVFLGSTEVQCWCLATGGQRVPGEGSAARKNMHCIC